ncbi:MAG: hypothetical protein REI45_11340 [Propionicimonas sp.]|nr:hypothetical protein [Propionicimonas sp.]
MIAFVGAGVLVVGFVVGFLPVVLGSGLLAVGSVLLVLGCHWLRIRYWRRRGERFPPVSGWGIVTDRQAIWALALAGVFCLGQAVYTAINEPQGLPNALWAVIPGFLLVAVVALPGVVTRHNADAIAANYLARHPGLDADRAT